VEDDVVIGGAPVILVTLAPLRGAALVMVVEEAVEDHDEEETEAVGRADGIVVGEEGPRRGRLLKVGRVILIPFGLNNYWQGREAWAKCPCVREYCRAQTIQ
jgi:hypothetical protein